MGRRCHQGISTYLLLRQDDDMELSKYSTEVDLTRVLFYQIHQGGFIVYKVRKMGSKSMTVLQLFFNKIFY